MYELFIQRAKEGCQLCEKSEPEHSTFVEALHCQVRATARRLLKVQQSSKTPRPTFYSPHKTWTMASRYDPRTCSSYRLLPFPKCWTTVFFKDFDVAKNYFGARGLVGSSGALAEESGNSWNLVICRRTNLPFPTSGLSAIVGQYQRIGLLGAQPTTWMPNWQTSPVHHCRPKQPVKPKGKTPISGELVLTRFRLASSSLSNSRCLLGRTTIN